MFKSMIRDLLDTWDYFNESLWKAYLKEEGRLTYERCLDHCITKYPHYVDEIRGMADGSDVPFEKVTLKECFRIKC